MDLNALGLGDVVKGNGQSSAEVQPSFVSGNEYKVTWFSMKKKPYKEEVFYEAGLLVSAEDKDGKNIFINIRANFETTENGIRFDEYSSKRLQKLYKAYGMLPDDGSLPIVEFDTAEQVKDSIIGERNKNMRAKVTSKEGNTEGKFWYNIDKFIFDDNGTETPGVVQTASQGSGMPDLGGADNVPAADDLPF